MAVETIPQLLLTAAAAHPTSPAVIGLDFSISYAELQQRVLRAGAALRAAGVAKGDRVAIWLPNSLEFIEAGLAVAFIGAVMVPISTRLKGSEVAYILRKARPAAIIAIGQFLGVGYPEMLDGEEVPEIAARFRVGPGRAGWDDWAAATAAAPADLMPAVEASGRAARADEIAEIMFTSGTTGFPKGAMLRHGQIVRAYSLWAEKLGMRAGDRYLIIAPMFHSFGYKAGVLASLAAAAAMYPLQTFEAPRVLEIIETHRISIMGGPPTIFLSLLAENQTAKRDMSSLRALGTGGAMVPASMIRALQKIGVQVTLNAYGLTESTALVTVTEPDDDPERIAATSGRVIPGVEMRCVKLDGSIAAPGEPGEIQARGYNVMAGYFDDADATAQTITPDGWLRTGDVGVIDEHGYLQITDRMKDMFIMGGFNCYPAEIERLITECPLVDQVAVIGVPDDRMGEVGKAYVVPKNPEAFDADALLAWCRDHMANYKVPREVEVVTALPRNAMGKVQKFILRNPR